MQIIVCEHAVTHGLSEMSKKRIKSDQSSVLVGDKAIFYNKSSWRAHQHKIDGFVSGAPMVIKKIRFRLMQKLLTRIMFGLHLRNRVICYVANLSSNNYIYSPGLPTDYHYHNIKKQVVFDVLGKIKDQCILKLYPTHRYLDDDPFLDVLKLPSNIKVIQYFEYRYLRAIADVIICDSPQSTLGWVWSARVPLIFLDLPSNPLLPKVAQKFDKAIFRIDCSVENWADKVLEIVQLPHKELLVEWKEKASTRQTVENEYILGPPGCPGKRIAENIL